MFSDIKNSRTIDALFIFWTAMAHKTIACAGGEIRTWPLGVTTMYLKTSQELPQTFYLACPEVEKRRKKMYSYCFYHIITWISTL